MQGSAQPNSLHMQSNYLHMQIFRTPCDFDTNAREQPCIIISICAYAGHQFRRCRMGDHTPTCRVSRRYCLQQALCRSTWTKARDAHRARGICSSVWSLRSGAIRPHAEPCAGPAGRRCEAVGARGARGHQPCVRSQERAKAYAFWGACLVIAVTSGPIVGGIVTDFIGWRRAFLINLPICAALFIAIAAFVVESCDHEAKRLDYAEILTFSAGLFLMVWAPIDGNALGWAAQPIVERFIGAAALLVAFLVV